MDYKDKIKEEKLDCRNFLKIIGITDFTLKKSESPDFIMTSKKLKVGIELISIYTDNNAQNGSKRRLFEEEWGLLQEKLMEKVNNYSILSMTSGVIIFKEKRIPKRAEFDKFIDELIFLAIRMVKGNMIETKIFNGMSTLEAYVKKFHLYLKRSACYSNWESDIFFSSLGVSEDELINTIKPKIKKGEVYKKDNFNELWLLCISGPMPSQSFGFNNVENKLKEYSRLDKLCIRSGFDNIFIYQTNHRIVYEWPGWRTHFAR
ncbi:MAG: hypothetical protein PHH44_05625 [bacterium]|nr:hypothetical protein [bacterium]